MAKPKKGSFRIATRDGSVAYEEGWTLGQWGMHKVRWFWVFTHLPTGLRHNPLPTIERKPDAVAYLEKLATEGLDSDTDRRGVYMAPLLPGFDSHDSLPRPLTVDEIVDELTKAYDEGGRPAAEAVWTTFGEHLPLKQWEWAAISERFRAVLASRQTQINGLAGLQRLFGFKG